MLIGILALQGAFKEHEIVLDKMGIAYKEIRGKDDLKVDYDALILPGGESTVQSKLINELDMKDLLIQKMANIPVLATCAGMILLAKKLDTNEEHLCLMPIKVKRNAYGRQLGSFHTTGNFKHIGEIPMTFIRAPYIEKASEDVEILAAVNNHIVAAKYNNLIALSFHPELDDDLRIYQYFINHIK